jgi:radical SAM superfamily enzyme YgiQ (UPF0313 family)
MYLDKRTPGRAAARPRLEWQPMASRILLISTNRCAVPDPVFPLGLTHLNAALREAGHETRWLDFQMESNPLEAAEGALDEFKPDLVGISLRNIDDVLIRKQETYFNELAPLSAAIRRKTNRPIVIGGSGFSVFPARLLEFSGADYGVCGPGEEPFTRLITALEKGGSPATVPGLAHRRDGVVVVNPPGPPGRARPLADADRPVSVVQHYLRAGGMLNLQTQRGCGFHCCYCTYPVIEGRAHERQAAEAVAEDFARIQRLGAKYAFVVDSVFNSSPRHVTEVCEAVLRRGVRLSWGCFLRPQGLTSELMKLMARAGLRHIEFGSDSFSDEVLTAYQKGLTFEDILRSSELARREEVDYCHFLIAGGPGETLRTLDEGFERSRRLQGAVMMAVVGMRIYPGTALFERAAREGVIRGDANLLTPAYYLPPSLKVDEVFARLRQYAASTSNWIVGDPTPGYARLVERLRQRGVVGPLWSYLSMIQRLWSQAPASPP